LLSLQVDAYETEVGILEKTLKHLQAHEWGKEDDHKALLEALGMERGQQAIAPEQRTEIIQDILQQQMQQVQLLRQAQMEQQCLAMLANQGGSDTNMNDFDDDLARELQDVLQLTDDQKAQLRESSKGLDQEVEALETVAASLQAMHDNEWLVNDGVQKMTDQFMSILHKNQQSKFLLWTDANAESVDQLDYVQVQPLQSAPIFTFGVETNPGDDDDK
jgi:LAS superfamily LD-carboxypeptidase LdcB